MKSSYGEIFYLRPVHYGATESTEAFGFLPIGLRIVEEMAMGKKNSLPEKEYCSCQRHD